MTFEKELAHLISKYSQESASETPDVILARYLSSCLGAFEKATQQRDTWQGRRGVKPSVCAQTGDG